MQIKRANSFSSSRYTQEKVQADSPAAAALRVLPFQAEINLFNDGKAREALEKLEAFMKGQAPEHLVESYGKVLTDRPRQQMWAERNADNEFPVFRSGQQSKESLVKVTDMPPELVAVRDAIAEKFGGRATHVV